MSSTSKTRSRHAPRLALVLLAPVAALAVLEIGFRLRADRLNRESLGAAFSIPTEESRRGDVRFRDIIQPDPNDRIVYELRPDLDLTFKGCRLRTNRHGFRGAELPVEAEPGRITIVGLGGSHMFGHGVADEQVYTVLLEDLLRRRYPARGWRVVNTAVPSYNAVMTIEVLKEKGLAFGPDLVLLHVDRNALDLPTYVRIEEDPYDFRRSFLLDFFREIQGRRSESERRYGDLAFVSRDQLPWNERLKADPETIPERYRGLVGWPPYETAMDELAVLSRERGFEVLAFSYLDNDINGRLLAQAAGRGFYATCFLGPVDQHLRREYGDERFTLDRYMQSDLVLGRNNAHPSPLLHRLTAEWLLAALEERGVIGRLLAAD